VITGLFGDGFGVVGAGMDQVGEAEFGGGLDDAGLPKAEHFLRQDGRGGWCGLGAGGFFQGGCQPSMNRGRKVQFGSEN
jgi:hypothetical protein